MTEVREIEISKIEEPERAIRTTIVKENLEELAESIKRLGILQPLIVRPKGEKFEIIAGHRRFLAAQMAGLKTLPCIVKEVDDSQMLMEQIHENIKREELNIMDQVEIVHQLREREGYSYRQIGEIFGKSETWARDLDRLWYCDDFIKEALRAGHIKRTHAYMLMKHPDRERRFYFLKLCIENGASPQTLDLWIRDDLGVLHTLKEANPVQKITDLRRGAETVLFTCALCNGQAPGDSMYVVHLCPECYKAMMEAKKWQKEADTGSEESSNTE